MATLIDARPAASVNGRWVTWGQLRPAMTEAAGAIALEEHILDQAVAAAVESAGLTITPDDVAAERLLLLESLHEDPDTAVRLLGELRDREGLGPNRFDALLMRNASLRALVRNQVEVTEEAIRRLHQIRYGPQRQARLVVVPDLAAALDVAARALSGERFGDIAVEVSIDSSAARGGLLEPISRLEPTYPEALRKAMWGLEAGEVSSPILLDDRYAVLLLVRKIDGDGVPVEEVREKLAKLVRLDQERLLMNQLRRSLVANVSVTVFDEALFDSWKRRRRSER
ncbi:MAG: peptidylprolyl isomerase [Phycisphaerales bacterium]|nr:MAG: peptidylprolyl isomerase [Phycisphaerales bacterium]